MRPSKTGARMFRKPKGYTIVGRERDQVMSLMARVTDAQRAFGVVLEHIAAREQVDLSKFAFDPQAFAFVPRAPEAPVVPRTPK